MYRIYKLKTIIIIPCFNEEKRLDSNQFTKYLTYNKHIHFIFINDGSSDNTGSLINKLKNEFPKYITVLNNDTNKGKAESIRIGILNGIKYNPNYIGFLDADLSSPIQEIDNLLKIINNNSLKEFVYSSRIQLINNIVKKNYFRYLFGRIFATVVSILFKLPIYDTQCGSKIFSINICKLIFKEKFISNWLIDVEIFARLINIYGLEHTIQISYESPVTIWIERGESKIKSSYFLKAPFELLRIYNYYKSAKKN